VLELGEAGSAGMAKQVLPVLRDGAVVATLSAARWKEAVTATIGTGQWVFARTKRELTGRRAADPEGSARLRARQTSALKGTWELALEGTTAQLRPASRWKGTYTLERDGRMVGELASAGGRFHRPMLDAGDLPLHQQVFVLWLRLPIRRREAAAAGAAAAGGAAGAS
jgi:putative intracellular protease/amidase